ncbi:MAG: hypothetical protein AAF655_18370 [Bacteroidota bacterium]
MNKQVPKDSAFAHQLSRCLKLIEAKLGWPNSQEWQNGHFEQLSQKIFAHTGVKLSSVTLKRVWGKVSYSSSPSMSTLDALAGYVGYENWIGFQEHFPQKDTPTFTPFKHIRPIKVSYVVGLGILGLLTGFLLTQDFSSPSVLPNVQFDFEPVTSGIPNTVTFTYDVSQTAADSAFIQQSWDTNLRFQIPLDQHFYASTYYYPGFYKAKLLLNEDIVQEKKLLVPSDGWLATVDRSPIPLYRHEKAVAGRYPDIDMAFLEENGFDLNQGIPTSDLYYVGGVPSITMDDTHFITTFQHSLAVGEAICQSGRIILLCTEGPILIPFSIPGCVGELYMKLVDHWLHGNTVDMTGLGLDFSKEVEMDIYVKDLQIEVWVDQQLAFQRTLKSSPGEFVGVSYSFHGTGLVHSAVIQQNSKEIILR